MAKPACQMDVIIRVFDRSFCFFYLLLTSCWGFLIDHLPGIIGRVFLSKGGTYLLWTLYELSKHRTPDQTSSIQDRDNAVSSFLH